MSLEVFNSLATFGTFVVIAATAIAALVQLRHARSANLIEGISEIMRGFSSSNFQAAQHFVLTELSKKWQEPEFRYQRFTRSARTPENQVLISKINEVGNFYENVGIMVKRLLVDRSMVLDMFSGNAISAWESLAPLTVGSRRDGGKALWENFEYFVVLSQDWQAAYPDGTYPPGVRRIELVDQLRDADAQYAASRATA
jgi:hypothetical protein